MFRKNLVKWFLMSALLVYIGGIFVLFQTDLLQEKDLLKSPSSQRCRECHGPIYERWKISRHAQAWTSEGYKKETEDYAKMKCLGCHIPQEIAEGEKPLPREEHKEEGISCPACHLREGAMRGPYQVFSPPHLSRVDSWYRHSKSCRGCHAKTFKEWEATGVAKTCHACHMPGERGKMIKKFLLDLLPFHHSVEVGDHSMPVVLVTEKEVRLGISREPAGNVKVVLENTGVPHALPTAENGDPRLYLEVEFLAGETSLSREKTLFAPQLETALPYQKTWEISLRVAEGSDRAVATLSLRRSWKKEKELLLSRELRF